MELLATEVGQPGVAQTQLRSQSTKRNPRGAEVSGDDDINISNLALRETLWRWRGLRKARKEGHAEAFHPAEAVRLTRASSNPTMQTTPDDPGWSAGWTHPSQHPARGHGLTSISNDSRPPPDSAEAAGQLISRFSGTK